MWPARAKALSKRAPASCEDGSVTGAAGGQEPSCPARQEPRASPSSPSEGGGSTRLRSRAGEVLGEHGNRPAACRPYQSPPLRYGVPPRITRGGDGERACSPDDSKQPVTLGHENFWSRMSG